MHKIINGSSIDMGTCYYPEHWPQELWSSDLDRMKAVGIETIRIAEFSWSLVEPEEGKFTFEFWDRFMDLARENGMQVIFCTPTATPPAWMSYDYPEILNTDMDGHAYTHGARRHYNYNSPVFRAFTERIVEVLAQHYGSHPSIIGWQLDNEFNCENSEFYSDSDSKAFREFLQKKYDGSLERLNEAWGCSFWNQQYTQWQQVDVPRRTNSNTVNLHRVLDYRRFISESVLSYAKLQADILRKYIKEDDFITTNGIFANIDWNCLTEESLDFVTYDSYPNFAYCLADYKPEEPFKDRWWSKNLTEIRAISPHFGIMEQQSGANGWNSRMEAPSPKQGQMTLWAMQSIAHGADYVSFFRWRTCTFGTEIYWHGILDYSGRDNRRLAEVKRVYEKMQALKPMAGAKVVAKVAVLKDYDNIWDAMEDKWHSRVEAVSQDNLFYELQEHHTPFDYVYLPCEESYAGEERQRQLKMLLARLCEYKVIFYPHPSIMTKERAELLTAYVEQGGKLVFGCRSAYKDVNAKCVMDYLPALIGKLCGTDIPEYSFISPADGPIYVQWEDEILEAAVFTDMLRPVGEGAKVLATYPVNSSFSGEAALIGNGYGKGQCYYFGGAFGKGTVKAFLKKLEVIEPYGDVIELPKECELVVRQKEEKEYFFVFNYGNLATSFNLLEKMQELVGPYVETKKEQKCIGNQHIEAYGVRVFVRDIS